ncbi:MAG: hypothetical protein R3C19_12070 [Planctomycetaceae bacterium]
MDQLGNWPIFTEDRDGSGTDDLGQDRSDAILTLQGCVGLSRDVPSEV